MESLSLIACQAVLRPLFEWDFNGLCGAAGDIGHPACAAAVLAAALLAVALSFRGFVDMFEADVPASQSHRGGTLAAAFF